MSETIESSPQVISTDEFIDIKPTHVSRYSFPDPAIRTNFASLLSKSFRASRADDHRHYLYFEFIKDNTNFDYITTLSNFIKAGGWGIFTKDEKDMFTNDFDRVAKHHITHDGEIMKAFHEDPNKELKIQLESLLAELDEFPESFKKTKEDFITKIGRHLIGLTERDFLSVLKEL